MNLLQVLQQVSAQQANASQPTDFCTGTVTGVNPLEITQDTHQAPLRQEILLLTECVVEKKIPILEHTHTIPEGTTDTALDNIVCTEHGSELPVEGGYIILNRALEVGDHVLLLSVSHGQKFIVLSRIFN